MATRKQIAANRRNSQESTGPRSDEGKARSSMNALKTGIDAKSQLSPKSAPAATPHCLMLFSGQYHFELEPFPRDSQVRPAIDLAMG